MADEKSALDFVAVPMALREELADAPMEMVGMALMLALYCGMQCNGGVIAGARQWSSRQTLIRVGLTRIPTEDAPGLWRWQGDDLHVLLYSVEHERRTVARRKAGRDAIAARWNKVKNAELSESYTNVDTMVIRPYNDGNTNVDTVVIQGKGKGKGKGGSGVRARTCEDAGDSCPAPTPAPDGFFAWLDIVRRSHPSASKSRQLAGDVIDAALDAFGRFPDAIEQVELLTAYFKDKRLEDNGFYAPRGQRKFFETLEDVVTHAERWRKWAGWKPKKKGVGELSGGAGEASGADEGICTPDEEKRFFEGIREGLGSDDDREEAGV